MWLVLYKRSWWTWKLNIFPLTLMRYHKFIYTQMHYWQSFSAPDVQGQWWICLACPADNHVLGSRVMFWWSVYEQDRNYLPAPQWALSWLNSMRASKQNILTHSKRSTKLLLWTADCPTLLSHQSLCVYMHTRLIQPWYGVYIGKT